MKVQQTPNPAAQFPSAFPPLFAHSVVVKQVPLSWEDLPAQTAFGKVTILNKENSSEMRKEKSYSVAFLCD